MKPEQSLVVVESPLRGETPAETRANLRYLLWCCRAEYLAGNRPIASHLICPWFMDDSDEQERTDGIAWPWMWDVRDQQNMSAHHVFYEDIGVSDGMRLARGKLVDLYQKYADRFFTNKTLKSSPECWDAYQRGEWPPHTAGFEVGT